MARFPSLRHITTRAVQACRFAWTRHSTYLLGAFLLTCGLIVYIWWPLAKDYLALIDWHGPWWRYMDWLLLGIWLAMSLLIMARADLRTDLKIVLIGMCGGLAIEGWGTQTNLWHYYTAERPPLWIIPAWPIASLSIDRLVRGLSYLLPQPGAGKASRLWQGAYWVIFGAFFAYLLYFVAPTFDKSLTWMSVLLCAFLILTPTDARRALLLLGAGAGLGYFLELWGTTRQCWTYYTYQTPPFFAVLAHGMAAVAFWRAQLLAEKMWARLKQQKGPRKGKLVSAGEPGVEAQRDEAAESLKLSGLPQI